MCLTELFQPNATPLRRFSMYNTDCDDSQARMNPGAPEVKYTLDNDCNGVVDAVARN